MTRYWLASAAALALMTTGAFAQSPSFDATNSTQPTLSTNGPAGTYDATKTEKAIDARGVETDKTQTFDKSQTYTSGNGELSAKTSIGTTSTTTTTAPPPPVSTTTTTTTTQDSRP
jgi:hypothetical protein